MSIEDRGLSRFGYLLLLGAGTDTAVTAAGLVLLLCACDMLHANSGFFPLIELLGDGATPFGTLITLLLAAIAIYLVYLYTLAALVSRVAYKVVYSALFVFAIFVEYAYAKALGRFSNAFDLTAALSATSEQRWFALGAFVDIGAAVPSLMFITCCCIVRDRRRLQHGGLLLASVLAGNAIFYSMIAFVNPIFFDRQFTTTSLGSFVQTTVDYAIFSPTSGIRSRTREIVESPQGTEKERPKNNIVFIFDESVRGDHLSLNGYTRSTTPYLEELAAKGLLINWGIAASASTISHPSFDAMITGATPEMIEQMGFDGVNSLPTLFQYAKAMNYRTHLFDGQMKHYWGGIPDDLKFIDNYVSMKEIDSPARAEDWEREDIVTDEESSPNNLRQWEIDERIARLVNDVFSNSEGNFIFVYKRGVHYPYEKNYPKSEAYWKPIFVFKQQREIPPAEKRQAVVNSYDNALRYNLDRFFRALSKGYSSLPNGTVIIYTSDHGQSFFVNGRSAHGGKAREEAMVPLFAIGIKKAGIDTRYRASHANVFSTLLDLMNYPRDQRRHSYQISLLSARQEDSKSRHYNPPPGGKLPFE